VQIHLLVAIGDQEWPQGDTYQKPVTEPSLGGAILHIGVSIAQILGRGKPARLLSGAIGALASDFSSGISPDQRPARGKDALRQRSCREMQLSCDTPAVQGDERLSEKPTMKAQRPKENEGNNKNCAVSFTSFVSLVVFRLAPRA